MNKNITFKGTPVTVQYKGIDVNSVCPNFRAVKSDMTDFDLENYKGKVLVINSFPSIDTGICAMQTVRFNKEMANYKDLVAITVSKDLPFALGRFCANNGIENAVTVSDYKYRDFENNLGGLINELALLARQVIIVDKSGVVRYVELVEEVGSEPNYEEALKVIKSLL
ncbi:thiol peroxidase [Gemella sp. GH3]|uniref:thiol peroxidase n=1 Tax=unclassified Gemella TaxID=2624949 RepID=UPI0015D057A2|nr:MULTISPECIES: thiol peroxidase [unclassified Gemella]MBF0714145.1 thiol peroxidase [Gemella sp. GH3.1]NYS51097.1 thiol peroxidase [Gemella sp. GH3]